MAGGNKNCTSCDNEHNIDGKNILNCKYCSGCDSFHNINDFGNSKQTVDGKECQCRTYRSQRKQIRAKEKLKKGTFKKYTYDNTKICSNKNCTFKGEPQPIENFWLKSKKTGQREARCKKCRISNIDVEHKRIIMKKWAHSKRGKKMRKISYEKNKPNRNKRNRQRRKEDIDYKIKQVVRSRIWEVLNKSKTQRVNKIKYLGIDTGTYKLWLESQFDENMSWENHGTYWHIDHVVPCAVFKFKHENDDAIYVCFNWKNTRPMYGPDNVSKNDTIDTKAISLHKIIVNCFILDYKINEPLYNGINKSLYTK